MLSIWHEIRAIDMGSQPHEQSPSHCPSPTLMNNNNVLGWQMGWKIGPESVWDTVCMQQDKGKATLAVSEDILASKQRAHQESSLPEATQPGEVLERVL